MLKLPKGLKKKKKGKKSKRKGEDELFTEEELEKYKREHQQQQEEGEGSKENEEWSKFKDLTTGVDSVLKKSQGDLDRIKSTSFFQRIPAGARQVDRAGHERPDRPPSPQLQVVQVTEADFARPPAAEDEHSDCLTEDDDEDDQDDIFDTSYVEAVERGEVKLAYVPDSPDQPEDDDIFDTSHVDKLIKGKEVKTSKGKKALDIGVAVEVLTGRIDNVPLPSGKRPAKRAPPPDLLLEDASAAPPVAPAAPEPQERSILDAFDEDLPDVPVDLSNSLYAPPPAPPQEQFELQEQPVEQEDDEFTQLAAESLEVSAEVTKLGEDEIRAEPVIQESWSAFEADKNESVFAEGIVEDQLDVDPYFGQEDPFDTSFAEAVVPIRPPPPRPPQPTPAPAPAAALELSDDEFDPRAEYPRLNNRRKSSVRIHLTDPSGERESITSDDVKVEHSRDLLAGSCSDLTQLDAALAPAAPLTPDDVDPFDTSIVDRAAPGPSELRLLEKELVGPPAPVTLYRVPSDPDFDPRAEEPAPPPSAVERRASRPENLSCKSVVFAVSGEGSPRRAPQPATPYYTRERSIDEQLSSELELGQPLHSPLPPRPAAPPKPPPPAKDPFDTSFAEHTAPSRTELRLLAKEFSCEDTASDRPDELDLLEPHDDLFQVKALSPLPTAPEDDIDPFDTSFATDLQPGRTEIKLLESEFLK